MRAIDHAALVGQRINGWMILAVEKASRFRYKCRCVCGETHSVDAASVRSGASKNCRACSVRGPLTHGATCGRTMSPEYQCWRGMLERCTNPNNRAFRHYGGRGIRVCERWQTDFTAFLADMGKRPSEAHSLDRYPNRDGNYEPGNVRWATYSEQARNKSTTRFLTHDGQTLCVVEWAERLGIPAATLYDRLQSGWPVERVLAPKAEPAVGCTEPGCPGRHKAKGLCAHHYQLSRKSA